MFGVEKLDERTQAVALLAGIVVVLSIALLIFFLATLAFVKPKQDSYDINPPGARETYAYGVVIVTFKEGTRKADAANLFHNLGLTVGSAVTDHYGRLVFEVRVEKGSEMFWLQRLKKEPWVEETNLKRVR